MVKTQIPSIEVEQHPLRPFLPPSARVLFLGSFPPPRRRWSMDFFYPNYINDHWRLLGHIFFADRDHFVDTAHRRFRLDAIQAFCTERGLAYYDTATAVRRLAGNASDKFLEIVTPTDIVALTAPLAHLRAIAVTGDRALQTLSATLSLTAQPTIGHPIPLPQLSTDTRPVSLFRLPSSSRAYPLPLERKAEAYADLFRAVGLL